MWLNIVFKPIYFTHTITKSITNISDSRITCDSIKLIQFQILQYQWLVGKTQKTNKLLNNLFWFTNYIQLYLANFIGLKIKLQFINLYKVIHNKKLNSTWYALKNSKYLKFYKELNTNYFYTLINLVLFKDLTYIVDVLQMFLTKSSIRKHKVLFYKVRMLLQIIYSVLQKNKKLLGFSLHFKGKLGKKGSVRKTKFFYKCGKTSLVNKSLKLNFKKFLVYTETGVIGSIITLFY